MKLTYDKTADALYIELRAGDETVSRTEQLEAGTLVDLDRFGQVMGIEVLRPSRRWALEAIVERFGVAEHDAAQLRAVFGRRDGAFPFADRLELADA